MHKHSSGADATCPLAETQLLVPWKGPDLPEGAERETPACSYLLEELSAEKLSCNYPEVVK